MRIQKTLRKTLLIIGIIALIIITISLLVWDPLFFPKLIAIAFAFILSIGIAIYAVVEKIFDLELLGGVLLILLAIIIFNGGLTLIGAWF